MMAGEGTGGPALELVAVAKQYGAGATEVQALCRVDLTVGRGEFVAVTGSSGSGKTTLLHVAGGLEAPSSGRVVVNGTDIGGLDAGRLATLRRRTVGYVFQRLNLVPTLTAVENVMLPLELDGTSTKDARCEAHEASTHRAPMRRQLLFCFENMSTTCVFAVC